MNYENDIFDYLGIVGREDSYTNLLKVLFENLPEYKKDFLKILFDENNLNADDFYFEIRKKYSYKGQDGKARNEIPDIIIVDKQGNHFALIEVKIFASEGYGQTQRYYDMFSNKGKEVYYADTSTTLNENTNRKFYFLTIYGTEPQNNEFKIIKWKEIVEPLKTIKIENEYLCALANSLINKVNSTEIIKNLSDDMPWTESMGYGWANEQNLFTVLQNYCFYDDKWEVTSKWNGYNNDSNAFELKCSFGKENWIGKHLRDFADEKNSSNIDECYQFHYEIAYNPETKKVTIRLDYHLQPYLSTQEIITLSKEKIEKKYVNDPKYNDFKNLNENQIEYIKAIAKDANEHLRKEIAFKIKKTILSNSKGNFTKKITTRACNNPMVLAKIENIETIKKNIDGETINKSINDIVKIINDFVECTEKAIDEFVEPYTNTEEQI